MNEETQGEVTRLLDRWGDGDSRALEDLMPLIFDDMRGLARAQFARDRSGHTLQPTALVHEAYLYLAGRRTVQWQSRAHFLNSLARLMRRILVDHARAQQAAKRGGDAPTVVFDEAIDLPGELRPDLVAVDDALKALATMDPRQSRVVELRFFAGLTLEEIGEVLEVSTKTVQREWKIARLFLLRELKK
jgi:RNA polymerase sigma-70 factor (ECF subfamily)